MKKHFQPCCDTCEKNCHKARCQRRTSGGNSVYALGLIGAAIYYITTASTFWVGVLGVLKAIIWPAFVVFNLMKYLQM